MKYDLLLKGGSVVDPSQGHSGLNDIAVAEGLIEADEDDVELVICQPDRPKGPRGAAPVLLCRERRHLQQSGA